MANMSVSQRSSQYVEVQLEIGHRATPKVKKLEDGHTHDWTVFVRGPENSNIQHFVEKVVFHLHESFPKPKRVVKEPPYQVSESGYASFELPVEVYFRNKEEPKKISFDYDLYLRLDDAVTHSRREKLTFQNPSNDFKKKLLKAGGVTNETNISSSKPSTNTLEEKQPTAQTSASNSTKFNKSGLIGTDSKRSKTLGVIPSKDKSLINSQNSTTTSSANASVISDKHTVPSITSSNNKQFTDLFGPPLSRVTPDAKNKEISSKNNKLTAIASKGVKNDSKSVHKSTSKNSFSSPHKGVESKSSKETKETKDSKIGSKTTKESKESTKIKSEEEMSLNTKSKKKSTQSPKPYDKKSKTKSSKKRRNSTSSNSSSLTASSFGGSNESKVRKDSQKLNSIKDKDNKKESKKQKVSSKDMNTASGVKKQSSTSTKISFSDNNSSTTIEIKSVKKEKTWDKEVKKSRSSKEFKSSEFKASKDKLSANTSASISANKPKPRELNTLKSPKPNGNKHLKEPKDKYISDLRERSSSPSSVSLTPDGRALSSPSIAGPNTTLRTDIESHESMSPLSSDNTFRFEPIKPNSAPHHSNSDDSDSEHSPKPIPKRREPSKPISNPKDSEQNKSNKTESLKSIGNKRKRDVSVEPNKRLDRTSTHGPLFDDSVLLNELIEMQKKINESTNSELLQKIVDVIEESGVFTITRSSLDFDLMKLDSKTIIKLKTFLY